MLRLVVISLDVKDANGYVHVDLPVPCVLHCSDQSAEVLFGSFIMYRTIDNVYTKVTVHHIHVTHYF